ncbi:MAG: ABC transporter permease [Chloroflexota bacterium]|nr:ABC transporter permease [Chloroflexota bacterium]
MPEEPLIRFDWIVDNLGEIGRRLGEHIVMTVIAVIVGFVISFALALLVRRYHSLSGPVLAASGVLYTIPSLALFALVLPFTGLSLLSAEIALVSYTVLILVRNVLTGLDSVPPDVSEAAVGMGFTASQRLWRIELPIALPVIVAGLRIATVTTIGLVTVTSLIGQGGLGYLIVTIGINRFFSTPIYVGAVLSVALAIGADLVLLRLQRALTPWARLRAS